MSRGRGRGGSFSYSPRASQAPEPLEPERLITEDIGAFIESISLDEGIKYPQAKVEQVIPVASYDWIDKASPTIAVPGEWIEFLADFKTSYTVLYPRKPTRVD